MPADRFLLRDDSDEWFEKNATVSAKKVADPKNARVVAVSHPRLVCGDWEGMMASDKKELVASVRRFLEKVAASSWLQKMM